MPVENSIRSDGPLADVMQSIVAGCPPEPSPEERERMRLAEAEAAHLREKADRRRRLQELFARRGDRYADCSLKSFVIDPARDIGAKQKAVVDALVAFCHAMQAKVQAGRGLLLYGPKGTGKDHLLAACMNAAISHYGFQVRWENGQDLFGEVRDRMDGNGSEASWVRSLVHPQILAISDPLPVFGDLMPHQANMLFRVIDKRYSALKPTWVTLNTSGASDAEKRMGGQIVDRLRDGALILACNWPTKREPEK